MCICRCFHLCGWVFSVLQTHLWESEMKFMAKGPVLALQGGCCGPSEFKGRVDPVSHPRSEDGTRVRGSLLKHGKDPAHRASAAQRRCSHVPGAKQQVLGELQRERCGAPVPETKVPPEIWTPSLSSASKCRWTPVWDITGKTADFSKQALALSCSTDFILKRSRPLGPRRQNAHMPCHPIGTDVRSVASCVQLTVFQ